MKVRRELLAQITQLEQLERQKFEMDLKKLEDALQKEERDKLKIIDTYGQDGVKLLEAEREAQTK